MAMSVPRIQIQRSYTEFLEFFSRPTAHQAAPVQSWKRPREGYLNIKADGAFHSHAQSWGWGFVVRDDQGRVTASGAGKIQHVADAIQVEAEACLRALSYASDAGMMCY
uniref:Uncharacterized protein n=1 Tax=Arundo donax TaxID=35708 RepID=A0A0A9U4Q8_ARUDO